MDLKLYVRVLSQHRRLLLIGFASALLLATLSYYKVTSDGVVPKLTPRKAEIWQSQANVFLTEKGFPVGRLRIPLVTEVVAGEVVAVPKYNEPSRLAGFASLYARFAQSDDVRQLIEKDGPLRGEFLAMPTVDSTTRSGTLPMVSLIGKSATAPEAKRTVTRGLEAFLAYMRIRQKAAGIPPEDRIDLRVINSPQPAVLTQPRKRTLPIVVFLAVMIATIAGAFILENARTSRRMVAVADRTDAIGAQQPLPTPSPVEPSVAAMSPTPTPTLEPEPEPEHEPVAPVRRWA